MTSEHYASTVDDAKAIPASCRKSTRIPIRRSPIRYDPYSPDSLRGRRVFTTSNDGKKQHTNKQRVTFPRHMNLKCAGISRLTDRRRRKRKRAQTKGHHEDVACRTSAARCTIAAGCHGLRAFAVASHRSHRSKDLFAESKLHHGGTQLSRLAL